MAIADDLAARRRMRREVRQARRRLDDEARRYGDRAIRSAIRALGAFRRARRIGIYFAFDGEPDLLPLLRHGAAGHKAFYAPVIERETMRFAEIDDMRALGRNRFGILEPQTEWTTDARLLDLVLTPLVAFDDQGTRIGVGKGYYDRCFEFLAPRAHWKRPKLLGIAYSFQEVERIEAQSWDVALWGVVTERDLRVFAGD